MKVKKAVNGDVKNKSEPEEKASPTTAATAEPSSDKASKKKVKKTKSKGAQLASKANRVEKQKQKKVNGVLSENTKRISVDISLPQLKAFLQETSQTISRLTKVLPSNEDHNQDIDGKITTSKGKASAPADVSVNGNGEQTGRAANVEELQERLAIKLSQFKGKKLTHTDKQVKTKLKRKLDRLQKKKQKRDKQKAKQKLTKPTPKPSTSSAQNGTTNIKTEEEVEQPKPAKPVYNSEGKMVFSKFDFGDNSGGTSAPAKSKFIKDPKQALIKLQKQQENLEKMETQGKTEKVKKIKEKQAWDHALQRAEGVKVKDNPELLVKSIKKKEQQKKKSKKQWAERLENQEKQQQDRQNKRKENIQTKKKEKKDKKLKKLAKKGRFVPGV